MKSYILVCSCSGQDRKAKIAYDILRPGTKMPEVVKGKDKVLKLGCDLNNLHIKSIAKIKGVFSYLVDLEGSEIVGEYNLVTGKRLQ